MKALSAEQSSDEKTEPLSPKMFGSKDYRPLHPQFSDKQSQIPKYKFDREHNFNPGGKFGPKKGRPINPPPRTDSPTKNPPPIDPISQPAQRPADGKPSA